MSSNATQSIPALSIPHAQLWAPALDASWLVAAFAQAGLQLQPIPDPWAGLSDRPLLVAYCDPAGWSELLSPSSEPMGVEVVAGALPRLLASGRPCRLVNLGCASVPTLVAWCLEPGAALCSEVAPRFAIPNPLDALLALELLQRQPQLLATYQSLEQHPLAAVGDGRCADLQPQERYRQASAPGGLRQQRLQEQALEAELDQLTAQLQALQLEQLQGLERRELVEALQERLAETDQLKRHARDLELSLEAQRDDLQALLSRLGALEQVLASGAQASERLQRRLPQLLGLA